MAEDKQSVFSAPPLPDGPFSETLKLQQPPQQRPPHTAPHTSGGIAYIGQSFLDGMTRGRIASYQKQEYENAQRFKTIQAITSKYRSKDMTDDTLQDLQGLEHTALAGIVDHAMSGDGKKKGGKGGKDNTEDQEAIIGPNGQVDEEKVKVSTFNKIAMGLVDSAKAAVGGKFPDIAKLDPEAFDTRVQSKYYTVEGGEQKLKPEYSKSAQALAMEKEIAGVRSALDKNATREQVQPLINPIITKYQAKIGKQADDIGERHISAFQGAPKPIDYGAKGEQAEASVKAYEKILGRHATDSEKQQIVMRSYGVTASQNEHELSAVEGGDIKAGSVDMQGNPVVEGKFYKPHYVGPEFKGYAPIARTVPSKYDYRITANAGSGDPEWAAFDKQTGLMHHPVAPAPKGMTWQRNVTQLADGSSTTTLELVPKVFQKPTGVYPKPESDQKTGTPPPAPSAYQQDLAEQKKSAGAAKPAAGEKPKQAAAGIPPNPFTAKPEEKKKAASRGRPMGSKEKQDKMVPISMSAKKALLDIQAAQIMNKKIVNMLLQNAPDGTPWKDHNEPVDRLDRTLGWLKYRAGFADDSNLMNHNQSMISLSRVVGGLPYMKAMRNMTYLSQIQEHIAGATDTPKLMYDKAMMGLAVLPQFQEDIEQLEASYVIRGKGLIRPGQNPNQTQEPSSLTPPPPPRPGSIGAPPW